MNSRRSDDGNQFYNRESFYCEFGSDSNKYKEPIDAANRVSNEKIISHRRNSFKYSSNNEELDVVNNSANYYLDFEKQGFDRNGDLSNKSTFKVAKWDKFTDGPVWDGRRNLNVRDNYSARQNPKVETSLNDNIFDNKKGVKNRADNRDVDNINSPIRLKKRTSVDEFHSNNFKGKENISAKNTSQTLISGGIILIIGLILSKLTGQVREILYGNIFQESYLTDAYVKAFLIPDFIYDLLIGGSIQAAIIPTLSSAIGTDNEKKAWRSVSIFISILSLAVLFLIFLGELFAPLLMHSIAAPEYVGLTTKLARTLFPQTFFMMLAALSIGIVNSHKKFKKTAFSPSIYNIGIILSLYFLGDSNEHALIRVGFGITFGTLFYFLFQLALGYREISKFRFCLDYRDKDFIKLLFLAIPTMLSSSIAQFSNMITHAYTVGLVDGSSTALRYATTVWLLPYGIFTVGLGQAMLPTLSELIGKKLFKNAALALRQTLRQVLFLILPSALIFYFFRYDIMYGIFAWGKLSESRVFVINLSADVLSYYCIAMVFQSVIYIMNFSFYSLKKTSIPLYSGFLSLVLMFIIALPLSRADVMGASGLSLAYAVSSIIMALLLLLYFAKLYPKLKIRRMTVFLAQECIACFVLLIVLIVFNLLSNLIKFDGKILQLIWVGAKSLIAYIIYFVVCDYIYMPEPRKFLRLKQRQIQRTK